MGHSPEHEEKTNMSQSQSTMIGNVTSDPELKFLANGQAKLTFSIAVNHYWTDQAGEKQEKASFFNVIAWRYTAEDAASILEKGVGVIVTGRLEQRSWEAEDGTKRSAIELVADTIGIQARSIESFERKRRSAEGGTPAKKATAPRTAVAQTITDNEEPF
jgi:single-strand DNA-binding protein